MMLFDDVIRTDEGLPDHAVSVYDWLNQSANSDVELVRRELEAWFARYPDSEKNRLRIRFRSEFDSAFFELFIHELLRRSNFAVTPHPEVNGTKNRPDFLACSGSQKIYVEAVLATDTSQRKVSRNNVQSRLYDAINRIDSPIFFLRLRTFQLEGHVQPSMRRIKAFLKRQLQEANPQEITCSYERGEFDAVPIWRFEEEGILLEVQAIPKSPKLRGVTGVRTIGIYPIESDYVTTTSAVRNAILGKAGRYGALNGPFIVAVNSLSRWGTDRGDVMEALFGTEQVVVERDYSKPHMVRARDGAFYGPSGSQCKRVSGVIVGRVTPWNIPRAQLQLVHNPWATHALGEMLLPIEQGVPYGDKIEFEKGSSIGEIFELPNGWPNPTR